MIDNVSEPTMTAISVRAKRSWTKALRELADRKGTTVGDMVREAVDLKFKDEIDPLLPFFERGDTYKSQSPISAKRRKA